MEGIATHGAQKLSDKLLDCFATLRADILQRDANLNELQDHVKRLAPLIVQFQQVRDTNEHENDAACEWLQRVSKEYDKVDPLRQPVSGILQLVLTSGQAKDVNKNLSKLLDDAKAIRHALPSTSQSEKERWKKGWDTSEPDITFGLEAMVEGVIHALTCGTHPWVVMSGMGGVGKTHTARLVYHDKSVRSHFTGGLYWVTVGKDKPPTYVILQALCEQILDEPNLTDFPHDLKDATARVKSALHGRTSVLIVLDDVWHCDIVKSLDELVEENQGVILVTIRDQGEVKRIADDAKFIVVPVLSEEESWKLFSKYAFRQGRNKHPELEGVAREVAKVCGGLPLALRVIGATMRDIRLLPDEGRRGKSLQSEWEKFLGKLQDVRMCYEDKYNQLFDTLQLSVDNLVAEDPRLFHCFCYFAAYPEDEKLHAGQLADLWISECMTERRGGSWNSQEQDVQQLRRLLDKLVHKSVVERDESGTYYMHDILRDLANRNIGWDFLLAKEISTVKKECLYAPALMSPDVPAEWTANSKSWELCKEWFIPGMSNGLRAERLSLVQSRISTLPSNFNAPRLRVLLLRQSANLSALPPGFFGHLSNLTLLDLSQTGVEEITAGVLRGLKKLRYLNASFCRRLRTISNEVYNLRRLEKVNLLGCNNLQCLPRVGSLPNLHTFSASIFKRFNIVWDDSSGWFDYLTFRRRSRYVILDMFHSHNLRDLHLMGNNENIKIPDVSSLVTLERLRIQQLPPPTGIENLQNLKILFLSSHVDLIYQIPPFDKLTLLENLQLELQGSTTFPSSFRFENAFPNLKKLLLRSRLVSNVFTFCEGTMPSIESVQLDLRKVEKFPKSLRNLHTVKYLIVDNCTKSFLIGMVQLLKEKGCFLLLEKLQIFVAPKHVDQWQDSFSDLHLDVLPSLKLFGTNCPREHLPPHIVDLEKQKNLCIRGG